jgi:ATP-dependent DNA helicase RecG
MATPSDPTSALHLIHEGARAGDLESQTLEFKEEAADSKKTIKDLVAASICFANADGGTIFLGVRDKVDGPSAFAGTNVSTEDAKSRIFEHTKPPLLVDVAELQFEIGATRARLLRIGVPESPEVHSDTQGRASIRVGKDCLSMDPSQQREAQERKRGIDWSAKAGSHDVSDLSPAAIGLARERLSIVRDSRSDLAGLSAPDLLRALGLVRPDGRLVQAAEVLFMPVGDNSASRVVYQYRQTPGGEPDAVERLDGPLVSVFARIMELVQARRKFTPVTLPTGQQIQVEDFPELAVREALANALMHRDYHADEAVTVEHSPEVFVVSSPGPLVSGVTPKNILTHPSKPRNARLAHAARILGLVEEVGRGVDRMYREMIRSGQSAPKIVSTAQRVRVTLVGGAPNTQLARYVAELPESERNDVDTMLILLSLCDEKTLSVERAAPLLQKTRDEAAAVLRRLGADAAQILEPTRETARRARPTYRLRSDALKALGTAVSYQRRTTDEIDRKIIEHVREYGKVTNRTVRNLLDVKTDRAAAILGDLVKRDVIIKTSRAQRGPSVEYGPGSSFPSARPKRRSRSARRRPTT